MAADPLDPLRRELAEPLRHPDVGELRSSADQTVAWLLEHFATLPTQSIGRTASPEQMKGLLGESAPEQGADFASVLRDFDQKVAANAFRVNHPRFLAFVPGAPSFVSVLGDMLCAGTNFFAGVWLEAAGPSEVELVVLDWFRSWLGMPVGTRGVLTGGGSEATLTALHAARETLPHDDRPRAILYCADQRHRSIDRAGRILGLAPEQIRHVPADAGYRLSVTALRRALEMDRAAGKRPWAVVATAGTTSTGAIDPLAELAEICQDQGLWLHVDAAYGWSAALLPARPLRGIEHADSVTLDPHKWFAQCFEAGCVLVRDGRKLFDAFATYADYMQDVEAKGEEINFADHGIALTRRFRALKIWLSVKVLGLAWYRELVQRCVRLAEYAEGRLLQAGCFEILSPPQLSILCFRYRPPGNTGSEATLDTINERILKELRADGRAFISSTRLSGRLALRFCFVNWRTTAADVDLVVSLLQSFGDHAERRQVL